MINSEYKTEYPIHYAVMFKGAEKVESLLPGLLKETQEQANEVDNFGKTPLDYALCTEKVDELIVKVLLTAGANIDARDNKGNTHLHNAALLEQPGQMQRIQFLLTVGANPLLINEDCKTPADLAQGYAKELLEDAAKKQRATNELFDAVCGSNREDKKINELIKKGGDVNGVKKFDPNRRTKGNIGKSILTHLTQLYIDLFYRSYRVRSQTYHTYLGRIKKVVKLGADPEKRDDYGKSAIFIIEQEEGGIKNEIVQESKKGCAELVSRLLRQINEGIAEIESNIPGHEQPVDISQPSTSAIREACKSSWVERTCHPSGADHLSASWVKKKCKLSSADHSSTSRGAEK